MKEPRWVERPECLVIHEMMLARHGGVTGVRDEPLLDSVLARPRERFGSRCESLTDLAASYAAGIVRTRPFFSGNLSTGFLVAVTFLRLNGLVFTGREVPVVAMTSDLAQGEATEEYYARFIRCNSRAP